ncbi:MAG: hypothetical protein U5P10_00140 [Spirochaetia bacterium]|nr:hypothetical protein [Spirochaetia bacterium]
MGTYSTHYIEKTYPPAINEYEITQIFQFTNDGIFKLLSKEDQEMITRGFYKNYSGDDFALDR